MPLKVQSITFDSTDPDKLADWWANVTDGTTNVVAPDFFVIVNAPRGPQLAFQKVDDPTPGKNKVHIDFVAPDMDAEVKRLVGRQRNGPSQLRRRLPLGGARRSRGKRILRDKGRGGVTT